MSAIASSYGVLQPNSTTLQCNASAIQCQSCLSLWDRSFIPVPHAAIIDYTNNLIWCVEHQVWPMSDGPTDTIFWSANWSLTYQMEGVLFLVAPTFEKVFEHAKIERLFCQYLIQIVRFTAHILCLIGVCITGYIASRFLLAFMKTFDHL